MVLSAIEWRIW